MKDVVIVRAWADKRVTLGMLTVRGVEHDPIFTLENPLRETDKDSRIPPGNYLCVPYDGAIHKKVYLLKNVPGRSAILLHTGNFESETEGCILLGDEIGMFSGEPAIMDSKKAFERFRKLIGEEKFSLTIL